MTSDSFLSNAGWIFFAAWSVVVAAVSIAAFGRDLLPFRARIESLPGSRHSDPVPRANPSPR